MFQGGGLWWQWRWVRVSVVGAGCGGAKSGQWYLKDCFDGRIWKKFFIRSTVGPLMSVVQLLG